MTRVGVLGIGNVLMGDDAVGPYAVKLLEARYELPPGVELHELGTPGADLSLHLEGLEVAIVIDAVRVRGAPGELRLLDKQQLLARGPIAPSSPHEPGLREALFALELRGGGPAEVLLIGVVPARIELAIGLSPPVQAALPAAIGEVLRRLEALSLPASLRPAPREPDTWWERGLEPEGET